jgi:hypothetical protein
MLPDHGIPQRQSVMRVQTCHAARRADRPSASVSLPVTGSAEDSAAILFELSRGWAHLGSGLLDEVDDGRRLRDVVRMAGRDLDNGRIHPS